MLRDDPAAHEDHHQRRHQRHRQQRGGRHRKGLGEGERTEQPSFLRFEREDRQERDGDDQQAEEQRRADLACRIDQDLHARLVRRRALKMLMGVLDHDDGGVDHGANRDGDAAETHDVGAEPDQLHADEGDEDADRQHQDGDERASQMQQEDHADQRHDDALLGQRVLQRVDRRLDQMRAVVDRHDLGALRQAAGDVRQALLDVVDHVQGIGAEALQHDAARHLALAVEFGDAAPLVRTDLDASHILDAQRHALSGLEHDVLDIGQRFDVATTAHDIFELGQLDRAAADILVAVAHGVTQRRERDALRPQPQRIDDDVVLLDEAADARDLGHALRLGSGEADVPILQRAQLGERHVLGDDGILVDPADAGRVRPKARRDAGRHALCRGVEIFEHAASRPIGIGAVLEDDIDEGDAEEGEAAHHLRFRNGQHRRRQGIGDLVLDHLRRLARIFRVDEDLDIREVGQRVERQGLDGIDAGGDGEDRADQDEDEVARGPRDEAGDHGVASVAAAMPLKAAFRLLSASIRKFAATTTLSPAAMPLRISVRPPP